MRRLTVAFIIISSFIFVSVIIPTTHVSAASKLPKGTEIANVAVEGMTEAEIRQDLHNKITIWQTGDPLLLKSNFEKVEIPRTAFEFDVDQTMVQVGEQTKGSFKTLFRKKKNIHIPLVTSMDVNDFATQYLHEQTHLHADALEGELIQIAEYLGESEITLTYEDEDDIPYGTIAEVEVSLNNLPEHIIERAASEIDGYIIDPETPFSYLKNLPIYSLLIDDIENTATATSVYELFLQTNFEVVERHTALHRTSDAKSDVEAYVHQAKNKDFIVHNPNDIAFILRAEPTEEAIILRLESTFDEATFDYEVSTEKIDYRTLYRYKKDLSPGYTTVIQEGEPGLDVKVEQSQYDVSEVLEKKTLVAHDTYLPVPRIVLTSSEIEAEDNETNEETTPDIENDPYESEETIEYDEETDNWIHDLNGEYYEDTQQVAGEERDKRIDELKDEYASVIDIWKEIFGTDENDAKEMKKLQKEIAKYKRETKRLDKEIQKLIKEANTNDNKKLEEMEKRLNAQQEEVALLFIEINDLYKQQKITNDELDKLTEAVTEHKAEIDKLIKALGKDQEDIKQTLTNYQNKLADLIQKVDELLEKDKDNKDDEGDKDAET